MSEPEAAAGSPLRETIRKAELVSVGTYVWEPGVAEPGLDNDNTPLRNRIRKMET